MKELNNDRKSYTSFFNKSHIRKIQGLAETFSIFPNITCNIGRGIKEEIMWNNRYTNELIGRLITYLSAVGRKIIGKIRQTKSDIMN